MDELTLLKDLRSSTPPITAQAELEARARLSALLSDPAQPNSRPFRRRTTWRMAVAAGSAAAIAATVTVALNLGGNGSSAEAAEVLDHAATAAASSPFTPPRPDQWIYRHSRSVVWDDDGHGGGGMGPAADGYDWNRADGTQSAFTWGGRIHKVLGRRTPTFPPREYAAVSKLPTTPDALLRWIGIHQPARGHQMTDFQVLTWILAANPVLPPRLKAGIFQAMKKLPGLTLRKNVKDLLGRPSIAITGRGDSSIAGIPEDEEILLAPGSYTYRGDQSALTADLSNTFEDGHVYIRKAGTVTNARVIITVAIVDKPGQQP
jgi:hypothetical protein